MLNVYYVNKLLIINYNSKMRCLNSRETSICCLLDQLDVRLKPFKIKN